MLGGAAIFFAANVALLLTGIYERLLIVVIASALMFVVGLVDDFRHLRPYQKLVMQIGAAAMVIGAGYVLPWSRFPAFNIVVTLLWLVGITNAINMLDNMDGLAAGIASIASLFAAVNFVHSGQIVQATILATFAAALAGFLVYNFYPASIFMGDCGSLFIGFFLASSVLMTTIGGRSRSILAVLTVPVLILFIPIFDTTLVTILRKMSGRAASQGGRDHTSHRLVALGLQERTAVLLLYVLAIAAGSSAVFSRDLPTDLALVVTGVFIIVMVLLGFYLARVKVYTKEEVERAQKQVLVSFLIDLSYKRRFFEVLLDAAIVALSYYLAYRIRFGPVTSGGDWKLFFDTLPLIIGTKIVIFYVTGLYRGLWRYVSFDDVFVFLRSVGAASIGAVMAVLMATRFEGFSRVVFLLDGVILFLFIAATRGSFRALRTVLRRAARKPSADARRAMIFGAGERGEILLRELRRRGDERLVVGFFDDDERKGGKMLQGLVIATGSLADVLRNDRIDELIVSAQQVSATRQEELIRICEEKRVALLRLEVAIVPITSAENL